MRWHEATSLTSVTIAVVDLPAQDRRYYVISSCTSLGLDLSIVYVALIVTGGTMPKCKRSIPMLSNGAGSSGGDHERRDVDIALE